MKRFVPLLFVLLIACGKEASVVPVISIAPSPTAEVTYEPVETPTEAPTEAPLITATPDATEAPTEAPATPVPTPVPTTTHVATSHPNTPTNEPPDAYLDYGSKELKGEATAYNWETSPGKRTAYTDQTPDPSDSLTVSHSAFLKIFLTRNGVPHDIGARYRTDPSINAQTTAIPINKANPATISSGDLPSGTVWVDVFTYWPDSHTADGNNVEHTFKLVVS